MSEVASERLNYLSKKQRAVSSRASRHIIPCSNGVTFKLGQTSTINLGGNQMATYWDASNSYLKFTVNNGDNAPILLESGYSLIDSLEVLCDGQVVSSIREYGACVHAFLDSEVGGGWKDNVGRALAGTSFDYDELEKIANGSSRVFCLPLPLQPFFNSSRYIPMMGRSTISFRITWASAAKGTVGSATDAQITINPCELVVSYIRLSAEANAMVIANTQGRFELICSDVRTATGNVVSGDSSLNLNCGFSFSSLDRIIFGFYPTLNSAATVSVGNRASCDLQNFALSVNGEEYPRKRIEVSASNVAEPIAEIMIGHRSLADFDHQSSLNPFQVTTGSSTSLPSYAARYYVSNPTGAVTTPGTGGDFEGNRGVFLASIDTESMKPHADPDALYSGLSTLGSVVQLVGDIATAPGNMTALVFAQYTLALTLDLNGSQTWVVSI